MRDEDERRRNFIADWESIGKGRDGKRRGRGGEGSEEIRRQGKHVNGQWGNCSH
jgi:hypothetical protein